MHMQVGLTNYAAAYCTGLLVARRILTKLGLAETYKGQEEPDGEDYNVEAVEDGPRPFYCLLDTGLKRTSTGSKAGCSGLGTHKEVHRELGVHVSVPLSKLGRH